MKPRVIVAALTLGLVVLGGGGGLAQSPALEGTQTAPSYVPLPSADPVAAVNAFLDVLVAKQWATLPSLTCAAQQDSVVTFYGITDAATEALLEAMQISIADRNVTLTDTSGSTATVTVAGQLSVQVPDEAIRTAYDQLVADADPSPAPTEIDQFVAQAQAWFQALTLATDVTAANESGGWLVCSPVMISAIAGTAASSPTASPVPVATADELAAACGGTAVPGAATYAGRVHPLVVVDASGAVDADSYGINTKWVTDAWPGPIQLVLCVHATQRPAKAGSCGTYKRVNDGKVGQVVRMRYAQVVEVVVASTGKTLLSKTIYGNAPNCVHRFTIPTAPPPWKIYGDVVKDGVVNKFAAATSTQKVR